MTSKITVSFALVALIVAINQVDAKGQWLSEQNSPKTCQFVRSFFLADNLILMIVLFPLVQTIYLYGEKTEIQNFSPHSWRHVHQLGQKRQDLRVGQVRLRQTSTYPCRWQQMASNQLSWLLQYLHPHQRGKAGLGWVLVNNLCRRNSSFLFRCDLASL